jgi:hypothetical protein
MAINVNKVYKSVLSILNKEQRGYLTPYEFNNLARQAQLEMLDGLFYQYNQFLNVENFNRTNEGYADLAEKIHEQIDIHYKEHLFTPSSDYNTTTGVADLPSDVYKLLDITSKSKSIQLEKVNKNRIPYLTSSKLTAPSSKFPIYYETGASGSVASTIVTNPTSLSGLEVTYVAKPADPRFGYTIDTNYGTEIYDANPYIEGGIILGTRNIGIVSTNPTDIVTAGVYTITVGTTPNVITSGSGTGATINLTAVGGVDAATITSVSVTSVGSGFNVGDTITIPDTVVDNSTGDIVLTLRVQDLYETTTQGSTDFTLHQSLESDLILSILGYAGLIIKDPSVVSGVTQLASANAMSKQQQ